jgi:endo-1,3(4)-beta-glucanase
LAESPSLTVPSIQFATTTAAPETLGVVFTQLNSSNHVAETPVSAAPVLPTQLLSKKLTMLSTSTITPSIKVLIPSANIFVPIATQSPLSQFPYKSYHPEEGRGIRNRTQFPLQTNKFYANFFLGSQESTVFTFPYSMAFTGTGMAVSHIERKQLVWGPGTPPKYYINPLMIQSIILSATSLQGGANLTTDSMDTFSVRALLSTPKGNTIGVIFPIVQGQAFITAIYSGAQPLIKSGVFFSNLTYLGPTAYGTTYKYRAQLSDLTNWLIYLTPSNAASVVPKLILKSSSMIIGPSNYIGSIQVSKSPNANTDKIYDKSAGTYPTRATISGTASGNYGTYTISWKPAGITNRYLLIFVLPHHLESMDPASANSLVALRLSTTTKGTATGFLGNQMTLVENDLPIDIGFAPWPTGGDVPAFSGNTRQVIQKAAQAELLQDITRFTLNPISMYWQGKGLAKYAMSLYAASAYAQNQTLTNYGLQQLKSAFRMFVNNQQQVPLYYDGYWGGITTSASYTNNDPGLDYGATYYNDHHFHYGYFVYAASVIAHMDPSWLTQGTNKAWVNSLVRDYANSVKDKYLPFSRMFDWWHGHSWAAGLFESADGKNEESTSEDAFSLYSIKMWGQATGDANMEARGNLQLAIMARSLRNYLLMEDSNKNQPKQFVPNRQAGIAFENKLDHTTYFGNNIEYIAGIHMLPIMAASAYVRRPQFVQQEWNTYFSNGRVDNVTGAPWRNLLYANLALIDPATSWNHFSDPNFDYVIGLDSGASWAWYLAFAAGMGGASQ